MDGGFAEKGSNASEKGSPVVTSVQAVDAADEGPNIHLKRGLNARHVSLMTFSGVIGTGIFLSSMSPTVPIISCFSG